MSRTFLILAFLAFSTCKVQIKNNNEAVKIVDGLGQPFPKDTLINLYQATIILPKDWKIIEDTNEVKIADATCRFTFQNKNNKIVKLEYGLGTGNMLERNVISARFRKAFIRNSLDSSRILFDDNPKLKQLRKNATFNISKLEVSGFNAQLYEQKNFGKGISGIYIDSIGTIGNNIAQLTLYAYNLDSLDNLEIKRVLTTLKLKYFE